MIRLLVLCFALWGWVGVYGKETPQNEESASAEKILDNVVETLEFHEAPIIDILRLLAKQNNLNLIIGPDSMGKISFRLSKVTLKSALDVMLRAKGFQYQIYDNILLITSPDTLERRRGLGLETRIFTLKYADGRDIKATIDSMKILSPYGNVTPYNRAVTQEAARVGGLEGGGAAIGAGGATAGQAQTRPDVLLITDKPPNLKKVAEIIAALDKPLRQVAIDVQFVEVVLGADQTTGINWEGLLSAQGKYQGKLTWQLGGDPTALAQGGAVQFGSLASTRFAAILEMLLQKDKARLLSQPRLTTIENQPAVISVGTTVWVQQVTGAAGLGAQQAITFEERRIPIELAVVPHILEGGRIMLELRPRVEEIIGWQDVPTGGRLPIISSRLADSRVEINDGETAVIGGLIKDRNVWTNKQIWFLGSLPLIGNLFRYRTEEVEKTELSIFITPRIIKPGEPLTFPQVEAPGLGTTEAKGVSQPPSEAPAAKVAPVSPPQPSGEPQAPPPVKTADYFPIGEGKRWQFLWTGTGDERWESSMEVGVRQEETFWIKEVIPAGRYKSDSWTQYRWSPEGLINYAKVTNSDTIRYDPYRLILPAEMVPDKVYESRYVQRQKAPSERGAVKEVVQMQRLIALQGVTTPAGRYPKCAVVETVTYDPQSPSTTRRRKVVWYALGIGPVKVEAEIPPGAKELKGGVSGYLARGKN
ncbi:MAG: hypothetical protein ACK4OO_03095 [bacterium]